MTAAIAAVFVIGLLAGVAAGYFYAVEAAAMGGTALLLFGLAERRPARRRLSAPCCATPWR